MHVEGWGQVLFAKYLWMSVDVCGGVGGCVEVLDYDTVVAMMMTLARRRCKVK